MSPIKDVALQHLLQLVTMKFFSSSAILLICLATCQASPLFGLGALKDAIVETPKKMVTEITNDIGRVTSDLKQIGGKVSDINSIVANLVTDSVAKLLDNIFKAFEYAGAGISSVEDSINSIKNQVGDQLKKNFENIAAETANKIEEITGQAVENKEALISQVQDGVSNLIDDFLKSYDATAQGINEMKEKLLEKKTEVSNLVKERIQKLVTDFISKTKNLSGIGKNVAAAKQKALEDLVNGINQLKNDVTSQLLDAVNKAKEIKEKIMEAQVERVRNFVEEARNLMSSVAEQFTPVKEKLAEVKEKLGDMMASQIDNSASVIGKGLEAALLRVQGVQDLINTTASQVFDSVSSTLQDVVESALASLQGLLGGLSNIGSSFKNVGKQIADKAQTVLQNLGGKVIEQIKGIVNNIQDAGGKMVETKKKMIQDASEKVNDLVKNTVEQIKAAGSNVFDLSSIAQKFTANVDKLIDEVIKNVMVAAAGAEEIRGNISETQKEIGSMVFEIINQLLGDITKNLGVGFNTAKTIVDNIIGLPSSLISG